MTPVSLGFAGFVAAGLLTYYAVGKNARWIVLLVMSLVFYASGGVGLFGYLGFCVVTSYSGALILGKLNEKIIVGAQLGAEEKKAFQRSVKKKKKAVCATVLLANFGLLFFLKYAAPIAVGLGLESFKIVLPLGISFYIFQATGYVIDVFRGKITPQKNFARYLLFVSFFSQMIQGPIGRYDALSADLYAGNNFDFENIKKGVKLICTGLFKKLVIADRAGVVASAVIDSYENFSGGEIAVGVLFYCIQLYGDFSGGIDIVRGTACLFGIDLAQNFARPLFSKSLTDFWRRWHMTLGAWMKDYLFYPITLSKPFGALGRFTRRIFKGRAGKILPTSLATFLIYFVIGIWHGANFKYIVFGFYNGIIITAALLCEPLFVKIRAKLGIDGKAPLFSLFQIARTCLIVFVGRYITRASGVFAAFDMLSRTLCDFSLSRMFAGGLLKLGLGAFDFGVVIVSTIVLVVLEYFEEKGKTLEERLEESNRILWFLYILACICVVVFLGFYGDGYISPEFIYKQF